MSGDLVGSRISLISRKDIRWEGILVHVDRENASVTLQSVKSWGTEGRVDDEHQIPASDRLHQCVQFRGEDIKDLHVHETAEPPQPATPVPPEISPLVSGPVARVAPDVAGGGGRGDGGAVSTGEAAAPAAPADTSTAAGAAAAGGAVEDEGGEGEGEAGAGSSMMRDQGLKPGRYQPPHKNPNWKPPPTVQRGPSGPGSGAASGTGALPGQGNHLLNRRTRGAGGGPLDEEGEFDFEAGLAKFDKEKEMALLAGGISSVSILDGGKGNSPGGDGSLHAGTSDLARDGEGGGARRWREFPQKRPRVEQEEEQEEGEACSRVRRWVRRSRRRRLLRRELQGSGGAQQMGGRCGWSPQWW